MKFVSTQLLVIRVQGYQITAPGRRTKAGNADAPCPSPSSDEILRTIISALAEINNPVSARVAGGNDVRIEGRVTDGILNQYRVDWAVNASLSVVPELGSALSGPIPLSRGSGAAPSALQQQLTNTLAQSHQHRRKQ